MKTHGRNPRKRQAGVTRSLAYIVAGRWQAGIGVAFRGRHVLRRHPELLPHLWRPFLFNSMLSTLVLLLWLYLWWFLGDWIAGSLAGTLSGVVWGWVVWLLSLIAILLVGIVSGLAALLAWRLLHGLLLGPIYADLSLKVERCLGVPVGSLRGGSWLQAVPDTLVQVGLLLALQILAFAANAIPIVGSLLGTLMNYVGSTSLLGLDMMGMPLSVRGVGRWSQLQFMKRHLSVCSGIGTCLLLCQAIPILGGFLTTFCLIGATELFHLTIDELTPPTIGDRGDEGNQRGDVHDIIS